MAFEIQNVPIHLKMTLTVKEAAEYSNIGINKIDSMLRMPNCPFVLYVGTKKRQLHCCLFNRDVILHSLSSQKKPQSLFASRFTNNKQYFFMFCLLCYHPIFLFNFVKK